MQARAIHAVVSRRRSADSWPAGWVKLFQKREGIPRCLLGGDIACGRGQTQHFKRWIVERRRDGEGAVDAWIGNDDHFMFHGGESLTAEPICSAPSPL